MAVLPSKTNVSASKQGSSAARFRQRKISVKQPLAIYSQKHLPSLDLNGELEPSQVNHLNSNSAQQQRDLHSIETGVDKNEEDEVHLQQVINAAQKALLGSQQNDSKKDGAKKQAVYIPTPDASKIWSEASKYYNDQKFREPESYIKFSATVEDTVGVEYNMDEDDEMFVASLNKNSKKKCSEIEFEIVCDKLEKLIEEKQPFLSMDPDNLLSYKEMSALILQEQSSANQNNAYVQSGTNLKYLSTTSLKEKLSKELKFSPFVTLYDKDCNDPSAINSIRSINELLSLYGEKIYEHWKVRKLERRGKPIHPSLKFEDPNANEKDNDNDPYICFRRREFRQARKTRRADTLGAERIRSLQKSLHVARDLVFSVAKRELLKLDNFKADKEIFRLRNEGKNLKRAVGIRGDDYLFYPHKRKRIAKLKEIEEEQIKARRIEKRKQESRDAYNADYVPGTATIGTNAVTKDRLGGHHQQENSSSTQPYVKLPPSKIPDMDLVTVSLILKEKNETIKKAVLEKLKKRKEQDYGYINVTDDPYQPFFNISTNNDCKELSHIPYSSIAASNYHEINTSNYMNDNLKKLLEDGKKPLPGMKTFKGSNGELVPSRPFPHLQSLLQGHINSKINTVSYVSQLARNIETNNFSAYSNGYGHQQSLPNDDDEAEITNPIFRLRKRHGRFNRVFLDRRGLHKRPDEEINQFLNFEDKEGPEQGVKGSRNVYDSREDTIKRLDSRWKFDTDLTEFEKGVESPFGLDPSKLNCISNDTQSIRFGSMLLAKSYDLLRESLHHKQQLYMQQARLRAMQQQQQQQHQQQQQQQQQQQLVGRQQAQSPKLGSSSITNNSSINASSNNTVGSNIPSATNSSRTPSSSGPRLPTQVQSRLPVNSPLLASQTANTNAIPQNLTKATRPSSSGYQSSNQLYNNINNNKMNRSNTANPLISSADSRSVGSSQT